MAALVVEALNIHVSATAGVRDCGLVDVPGPLLRRGPLWLNSCKRPPPVSDNSIFAFGWSLTGGSSVMT